jgi:hypothetical protein
MRPCISEGIITASGTRATNRNSYEEQEMPLGQADMNSDSGYAKRRPLINRTYEMFPILAGVLEMLCQCRYASRLYCPEGGLHGVFT